MPIRIDGTDITGATIDGTDVTEITVDGQTVFSAAVTSVDSFEEYSTGSGPGGNWTTPTNISATVETTGANGASAIDGSNLLTFDGDPGNDVAVAVWTADSAVQPTELQFFYNEQLISQTGILYDVVDDSGNRLFKMGTNNPNVEVWDDSGRNVLLNSPTPEYNEWRKMTATIDWNTGTFDVLWEDITGSSSDQSQSGFAFQTPNNSNALKVRLNSDEGGGSGMTCSVDATSILGSL